MRKPKLTAGELRERFDYDPEEGVLIRKHLRAMNLRPETGTMMNGGYMVVGINGEHHLAHRLAWLYVHGDWPPKQVEHVNGDKTDNRIANLRLRNPAPKASLTEGRLKDVLRYEPSSGKFFWRASTRATKEGAEAGSIKVLGYRMITIDGAAHYAHRLAWLYTHGDWPRNHIDHINGDRDDNRLENLRDISVSENSHNTSKLGPRNTTGFRGVARYMDKFIAQIMVGGKSHAIGMFDTAEAASAAYAQKHIELYGEPPSNGNMKVYPKSRKRNGVH